MSKALFHFNCGWLPQTLVICHLYIPFLAISPVSLWWLLWPIFESSNVLILMKLSIILCRLSFHRSCHYLGRTLSKLSDRSANRAPETLILQQNSGPTFKVSSLQFKALNPRCPLIGCNTWSKFSLRQIGCIFGKKNSEEGGGTFWLSERESQCKLRRKQNIARVQNSSDITIWNFLFVLTSLWSNVWRVSSLQNHTLLKKKKVEEKNFTLMKF